MNASTYGHREFSFALSDVCMLSMLHETGLTSGQTYQPDVNFRQLNPQAWYAARRDNVSSTLEHPPMMACLCDNGFGSTNLFSSSSIALLVHSINECGNSQKSKCGVPYYSNMCFKSVIQSPWFNATNRSTVAHGKVFSPLRNAMDDCEKDTGVKLGRLRGRYADYIRPREFARMLQFFGYRWTTCNGDLIDPEDDDVLVETNDIERFLKLFSGVKWETEENFQEFIERFRLQTLYSFRSGVPLHQQREDFGYFFRSLCQPRIALPDGQHRVGLLCLMSNGYGLPEAVAPLVRRDTTEYCDYWNEDQGYAECDPRRYDPTKIKIHQGSVVRVVVPSPYDVSGKKGNFASVCATIKKISLEIAIRQSHKGEVTAFDIVDMVLKRMRNAKSGLVELGFHTFWRKGCSFDPYLSNVKVSRKRVPCGEFYDYTRN